MSVDVISGIYGSYETPKAPVPQEGIDVRRWVLVTDNSDLEAPGWDIVVERRPHVHPNVAAKVPKFRPDLYSDADFTLWIDGHALIQPTLVAHCVNVVQQFGGLRPIMGVFPHPQRVHLMDEVEASRGLPKYDELDLEGQVRHYLDAGYSDANLFASGCIIRDMSKLAEHQAFGDAWLREVVRWGFQDQLSLPYVLEKSGIDMVIAYIGPDLWSSPHVWFGGHG